ncbi:MAG: FxsA family protein [bacterium]|nr:FxsA family protein [bacterium]
MPLLILALFISLPIAEIALLIKVADYIDLWPTILLIILTAVIGVYLLRLQGLSSLARAQTSLNEGRLPVNSITDAVGLMLAGAFLLTPGLITDTLGFALLIPAVRHGIASYFFNKAKKSANIKVDMFGDGPHDQNHPDPFAADYDTRPRKEGPIIEGEMIESEPSSNKNKSPQNGKSPWEQ